MFPPTFSNLSIYCPLKRIIVLKSKLTNTWAVSSTITDLLLLALIVLLYSFILSTHLASLGIILAICLFSVLLSFSSLGKYITCMSIVSFSLKNLSPSFKLVLLYSIRFTKKQGVLKPCSTFSTYLVMSGKPLSKLANIAFNKSFISLTSFLTLFHTRL